VHHRTIVGILHHRRRLALIPNVCDIVVGADDCVREISVAMDQQQPSTFTDLTPPDQSFELEEGESESSIA